MRNLHCTYSRVNALRLITVSPLMTLIHFYVLFAQQNVAGQNLAEPTCAQSV